MDELMMRQHKAKEVRAAVDALPGKQLAAVLMHKYEGMDYAEIAGVRAKSGLFRTLQVFIKTSPLPGDKFFVSRFVENAMKLMNAAESAVEAGHSPSDMAILISAEGGIRMVANSTWPLASLQAYHGSRTAYRVSKQNDKVRVDGREAGRTCTFESEDPTTAARLILGGYPTYSFLTAAS